MPRCSVMRYHSRNECHHRLMPPHVSRNWSRPRGNPEQPHQQDLLPIPCQQHSQHQTGRQRRRQRCKQNAAGACRASSAVHISSSPALSKRQHFLPVLPSLEASSTLGDRQPASRDFAAHQLLRQLQLTFHHFFSLPMEPPTSIAASLAPPPAGSSHAIHKKLLALPPANPSSHARTAPRRPLSGFPSSEVEPDPHASPSQQKPSFFTPVRPCSS